MEEIQEEATWRLNYKLLNAEVSEHDDKLGKPLKMRKLEIESPGRNEMN